MGERTPRPRVALLQLLNGAWVTQALHAAAKLRLADFLAAGPLPVEELARQAGTETQTTARLLRTLAMFGVFSEVAPDQFALTPMSEHLRSDRPDSLYHWALMQGEAWHWQAWGGLAENVRTGHTAFELKHQLPLFEFLDQQPEAATLFNSAMAEMSSLAVKAIVQSYDFSAFRRVADVGGGEGILLQHLLEAHASVHGVLFDRPAALDKARARLKGTPLESRIEYQSGNFFETVPSGADAYVLKHILHDWNDVQAGKVLRACRAQLPRQGRLLAIEYVLPAGDAFSPGKLLDLEMMVVCGGQERTLEHWKSLMADNGLTLDRVIATPSGVSIIEASPA
ncbi:methyltransferase [Stigmatella sp. ncwal1]|uniref:Methyltransferase n=1 Tax=Stigmatella ashevillensis TaxID=2995309 RepID=A0ABT5D7G3_9BACT|nr:methyltransferase [Stigmatella ashevillena]MDC0708211.1 methyltransferase [Stigmatella ashevillena]